MFSLRTISLYAAIACATLSSAAPLETGNLLSSVTNLVSGGGSSLPLPRDVSSAGNIVESLETTIEATTHTDAVPRADVTSLAVVIKDSTDQAQAIATKIEAAVSAGVSANVDINVVVGLLGDIVVLLNSVVADVTVLVKANLSLDVLLTLNGAVLVVADVAVLVYGLLSVVVGAVYSVVIVVGTANVAIQGVVVTIGGLLVNILVAVFGLVVGLDAAVIVLVQPLVVKLTFIQYTNVLALLKVQA